MDYLTESKKIVARLQAHYPDFTDPREVECIQHGAEMKLRDGWTLRETYDLFSQFEEVNPYLSEEDALRRIGYIHTKVAARKAREATVDIELAV